MKHAAPSLLVLATVLAATACAAAAARTINIGAYSQLDSPSRASAGGSVYVGYRDPGSSGVGVSSPIAPSPASPGSGTPYTSSGDSSNIDSADYVDRGGAVPCADPVVHGTCFRVPVAPGATGPRAGRGAPPVDPQVLARLAVDRLAMLPGSIRVSPSRQVRGLTGAPSWFWLDPAPTAESVTVAQGAESVTVTATPARVGWNFGDGDEVDGGPGRPYGEAVDRRGAMRHRYRTRCLPGDQGGDPYVLASCTDEGYQVQAGVEWTISFQAVGPIATAGGLPPQTTTATIAYPVTEVRGFLARDGAAR
jgi:hypothetical protein